jgi:hypothetical protein
MTARVFGLRHKVIDASDAPDFDAFFDAADQPSIDGLNIYIVAGAAAREGFRVALSGIGADELFAGYKTFRRIPMLSAFNMMVPGSVGRAILGRVGGDRSNSGLVAAGRSFSSLHEELRRYLVLGWDTDRRHVNPNLADNSCHPMDRITEWNRRPTFFHPSPGCGCLRDGPLLELRTPFVDHWCWPPGQSRTSAVCDRQHDREGQPRLGTCPRPKRDLRLPFKEWLAGLCKAGRGASRRAAGRRLGPAPLEAATSAGRRPGASLVQLWSLVVLDAWMRRNRAGRGTGSFKESTRRVLRAAAGSPRAAVSRSDSNRLADRSSELLLVVVPSPAPIASSLNHWRVEVLDRLDECCIIVRLAHDSRPALVTRSASSART